MPLLHEAGAYNACMAGSLKVPKAEFEAAIKALLSTKPMPLSDTPRKSEPKAAVKKSRGAKRNPRV